MKDFSAVIGKVFSVGERINALMYSARNMAHIFMIDAASIKALDLQSDFDYAVGCYWSGISESIVSVPGSRQCGELHADAR
jgi:hypothetical protein